MGRLLTASIGLVLALPAGARAFDVHLDTDTSFQVYEVRSPGARTLVARRRLLSRLGIRVNQDLTEPDDEGGAIRLGADAQLRLEQDFGETCLVDRDLCVNANDSTDPGAWQPLAADTRLDVPSVWIEVNGLPLGTTARFGRQLQLDTIGFARFDGGSLRVEPLRWVRLESYAGLLVRGTSLAATPRSEPPGAIRLDAADRVPWALPGVDTWVAGANVSGGPGRWLNVGLGFRHMWEPDGEVLSRVSGAISSQPAAWLRLDANAVWDLLTSEPIEAAARVALGQDDVMVRAAVSRHVPRFDPGTIWAWFSAAPIAQAELGVSWQVVEDLALGGALRGRHAELGQGLGDDLDGGFDAWLSARWEGVRLDIAGFAWTGALGPLAGVSLDVSRSFFGWLELGLDVSVWHFDDPNRRDLYGTVVSEAAQGRIRLSRETLVLVELQHATSRVVGHRFRGLLALRVETWR